MPNFQKFVDDNNSTESPFVREIAKLLLANRHLHSMVLTELVISAFAVKAKELGQIDFYNATYQNAPAMVLASVNVAHAKNESISIKAQALAMLNAYFLHTAEFISEKDLPC